MLNLDARIEFEKVKREVRRIDKELSRVSRSAISDDERAAAQNELRNKKKTARDNRDFAAQFLLTPQQRITYNDSGSNESIESNGFMVL
jgi:hypothetical protein